MCAYTHICMQPVKPIAIHHIFDILSVFSLATDTLVVEIVAFAAFIADKSGSDTFTALELRSLPLSRHGTCSLTRP